MHPEEGNYKVIELGIQAKRKETTKLAREIAGVRPQTRAQSNNKPKNNSIIINVECSSSSKMRLLRSYQIVHIKHEGTKFQTTESCLPNQLCHP